jgi:hypothetical protein
VGNRRMRDRLETSTGYGVCKNPLRQGLTIEDACRSQNIVTKNLGQLRQRRTAWIDDLPCEQVCADQQGTTLDKKVGNGTFT